MFTGIIEKKAELVSRKVMGKAGKLTLKIVKDYEVFGDELWNRFNEKRKECIAWYYKSIGEAMACLQEYPQYHEYQMLVKQVFGENNLEQGEQ